MPTVLFSMPHAIALEQYNFPIWTLSCYNGELSVLSINIQKKPSAADRLLLKCISYCLYPEYTLYIGLHVFTGSDQKNPPEVHQVAHFLLEPKKKQKQNGHKMLFLIM